MEKKLWYWLTLNTSDLRVARKVGQAVAWRASETLVWDVLAEGQDTVALGLGSDLPLTVPLHTQLEAVIMESRKLGVTVAETRLEGAVPIQVVVDTFSHCLRLNNFHSKDSISCR